MSAPTPSETAATALRHLAGSLAFAAETTMPLGPGGAALLVEDRRRAVGALRGLTEIPDASAGAALLEAGELTAADCRAWADALDAGA